MPALTNPSPDLDTWTSGSLVSSDMLNKNIRDVQKFLAYAPLTIVMRTATQSIANAAQATITWDTEVLDVDGMFTAPSTNLVVQRAGVYSIQYQTYFAASAINAIRSAHITINGNWVASANNAPASGQPTNLICSSITALNKGDIITGMVYQDSGGALNQGGGYNAPRMAVRLLSTANLDVTYVAGAPVTSNPKPPPSKPPTPHVPTKFTKTYFATWSRSYAGDGSIRWDDSPYCYQGFYPGYGGNQRSLIGFNYSQIRNDLRGASNIKVKFTFKGAHSYYNSGMTVILGTHTYTGKPGSWNSANVIEGQASRGSVAAGGTYTYDFSGNSWFGWAFQTGNANGMAIGPGPNTSFAYYGFLNGATQGGKPYLTISYTK